MAIRCSALTKRMGIDGRNVSLKIRIFFSGSIDRELSIENEFLIYIRAILRGLPESGDNELGFGRFEFSAQGFDEMHKVLLILFGVRQIIAILITLPPGEANDLISSPVPVWKLGIEVVKNLVSSRKAIIVLLPGIPRDRVGLRALIPAQR